MTLYSGTVAAAPGALLTADRQSTLAERLRKGEPGAEEELIVLFKDRIVLLAYMRTGDREAARDLAQDVLLAVLRALRGGQLREPERLAGFIYGTARNLINNYIRARMKMPRQEPLDPSAHFATPAEAAETSERSLLVRRTLGTLGPLDRQILLLTLVEGLKPREIGARLGLASEVVRARKSRALKKITDRLRRLSRS